MDSLLITLPETNIAPENGCLEYDPFLLGFGLFSGAKTLVSGRVILIMIDNDISSPLVIGKSPLWGCETVKLWGVFLPTLAA